MSSGKVKLKRLDIAEHLRSKEEVIEYLRVVWEEDGIAGFLDALGDAARALGMMQIAKEAGVTREGLYRALSADGNPSFKTVAKVAEALGIKLDVQPITQTSC